MQTIYIDISNKSVLPPINAKQNDVGRKFLAILTDSGLSYNIPNGAVFSVFYSGDSGEGNYTDIGSKSAFSVEGNAITVEIITQMLTSPGKGLLCLVLNGADGIQVGSWNIPYTVESVPGSDSEVAQDYYTAFSKAVAELPIPDKSLSIPGKAADAAAVGNALAGKAPAGYGLGMDPPTRIEAKAEVDDLTAAGWWEYYNNTDPCCGYGGTHYGGILVIPSVWSVTQLFFCRDYYGAYLKRIRVDDGAWQDWEWVNPPMELGQEYRTTERYKGSPVYTMLVDCGVAVDGSTFQVGNGTVFRHSGNFDMQNSLPYSVNTGDATWRAESYSYGNTVRLSCSQAWVDGGYKWYEQVWWI